MDKRLALLERRLTELEAEVSALRATAAAGARLDIDELTVGRLNVAEPDGRLRLVASNTDRCPAPVVDGRTAGRSGGNRSGLIFYNEEGDECGGLVFSGTSAPRGPDAGALLAFDQFKHDQIVGLTYFEGPDGRQAGLRVWDHDDPTLWTFVDALSEVQALPEGAEKQEALRSVSWGQDRLFAGRTQDEAAAVVLYDGRGRPRLRLQVAADGAASIEFLDDAGNVDRRIE